ncbi:uncharacterized protein HMPREF1120_07082 [Exophiala dermatitidis NIH/UT8656]|uniref:Uncharacterized protein n=1 Tax=Exophiala dermatitidis (strain ATCC 34100 / CBS 525.76 / NIH/UT8656) TaxID=858893 RepID=H6C5T7_EXODN|nr:uncharacterized protein HMPREF1120_07082 [Exophiala dermatitidis NIH/UT8656]EHY59083.1 hypothetical protein HMPREF1120_07082 [Exophiala dermatitidis NIH/UT8656]
MLQKDIYICFVFLCCLCILGFLPRSSSSFYKLASQAPTISTFACPSSPLLPTTTPRPLSLHFPRRLSQASQHHHHVTNQRHGPFRCRRLHKTPTQRARIRDGRRPARNHLLHLTTPARHRTQPRLDLRHSTTMVPRQLPRVSNDHTDRCIPGTPAHRGGYSPRRRAGTEGNSFRDPRSGRPGISRHKAVVQRRVWRMFIGEWRPGPDCGSSPKPCTSTA